MRRVPPAPRVPRWRALAAAAVCAAATVAASVAGAAPAASATAATAGAAVQRPAAGPVRPAAAPVTDRDPDPRPHRATYRLAKVVSSPVASQGDTVEYAVAIRNDSATTVPGPVVLQDTLPGGVEYVSHRVDTEPPGVLSTITLAPPGPEARTVTWSFPNGLPAHLLARLAITVTVTVQGPIEQVDRVQAVAGPKPTVAPANQCLTGPGDVEHQACAYLWIRPLADIALTKRVGTTTAVPGQQVQYTVTVDNLGPVAVGDITVADDLSDVVDDARYNGDANTVPERGRFELHGHNLVWNGALAAGETIVIRFSVTVRRHDRGNHLLANRIFSPVRDTNCPRDTGAGLRQADRCSTRVRVADLRVVKRASARRARPGHRVRYTVDLRNVGRVAYSGSSAATLTDDLRRVLDDARYDGDAEATSGTVRVRDGVLTWRGDLAPGGHARISYTVTVRDGHHSHHGTACTGAGWTGRRGPSDRCGSESDVDGGDSGTAAGDGVLRNRVVSDPVGSNCRSASRDPDCATTVRVARRHLAYTGRDVRPAAAAGLGLLAGGLLLLAAARPGRRRGRGVGGRT